MADDVDISLKLGTEADLSSAISAGARAGAAFAAAAQNAVGGIKLDGATSSISKTLSGTGSRGASLKGVVNEIKSLGLTTGLAAQMATERILRDVEYANKKIPRLRISSKPQESFWPNDNAPENYTIPDPLSGFSSKYVGTQIDTGRFDKTTRFIETVGRGVQAIEAATKKQQKEGLWVKIKNDWKSNTWGDVWGDIKPGLAAAKVAQHVVQPAADYAKEYYGAQYRAATARSSVGLMQERVEKDIALRNMKSEYGMIAGAGAGAAFGSMFGPFGTILGGTIGGIAGLINKTLGDIENTRQAEELKQQLKTAGEVQKREGTRSLLGGAYSVGYAKTFEELGLGGSEDQVFQMATNALTFRGRQAFGQVGLQEYTMMAQVPNYFAAVNNGVTDPQVLHSLLKADLDNLGDPQMAAYIASQLPGVGLGTYSTLNSKYYGQTFNRLHSRMIRGEDRGIADISAGYLNKHARNVVLNRALEGTEMRIDAYQAPKSLYAGYKPNQSQYEQDVRDKRMITQAIMREDTAYAGNNYTINVVVDNEIVKTENIQERDFIMGGMSYTAGGY